MKTRRRNVLLGATAIAAAGSLPMPAIAQGIKDLERTYETAVRVDRHLETPV